MPHPSSDRTPTRGGEADAAAAAVRRVDQLATVATGAEHDETLTAQLDARDRASAEDARTQAEGRRAAAVKALAHLRGDAGADEPGVSGDAGRDERAPEAGGAPEARPTAAADDGASPGPPPATETAEPGPADTTDATHGAVPVPTGGPAAVVAQVFGAAAAEQGSQSPAPPLLELRPSTIGAGVDQLGDRVLVYDDRVEHRDRHGRLRRTMRRRDVTEVLVQRRLTGTVLELHSRAGLPLVLKGVRPDAADEVRRLLTPTGPAPRVDHRPTFDEGALLHKLVDLHRAGVLDEHELAAKTEVVARLARDHRDAEH
ncbi:hypothetical protein [Rhabdothermincola salaria]|uniref:hypothetical protein n=1 Tax=Rhabdothermincola salaria TaxID=2903142 RepID=UPI001E62E665|nr:hypothetical protein [Rhabdothermincola salaria]MCD9623863.1 hypothetical protein [Rhabdothermincola salaria]